MDEPSKLTAWERWELASFDTPAQLESNDPQPEEVDLAQVHLPTAEEVEQIHQQARDEGYQKGYEEGLQEGKRQGSAQGHEEGMERGYKAGEARALEEAERLIAISERLDGSFKVLEEQVAEELLALAIELAREVVRSEISAHPETLLAVVREALTQLPHQHVSIYLHPDDASLLRSYQGDQLSHAGHRIHEDFKLSRGDCLLETGGSQLDATVAMRWRRVLEGLGLSVAWQAADSPLPAVDQHEP